MACICERDGFHYFEKRDSITYRDLYYLYSENGGPNASKVVTEKNVDLYLRVSYPYLWETTASDYISSGSYMKRLYNCPLCGRSFPSPKSILD